MDTGPKIKKTLNYFIEQLRSAGLPGGLKSVILYGSTAGGERAKGHSDINVLIALDKVRLEDLRGIARIKRQRRFKGIDPLVLSLDYMGRSVDTFPIEFLDMKENYIVLYGDDCLKGLEVELSNLRHQCEWELKSKIIRMQKFYIESGANKNALKGLLLKSLPSFIVVFKNILRLKNIAAAGNREIINRAASEFGLDADFLRGLWETRSGGGRLDDTEGAFEKFLFQMERLSQAIDSLSAGGHD